MQPQVISSTPVRRRLGLKEVWDYRYLLGVLIVRDIRVRYKQAILGVGWAILKPVATMLIFSFVFGTLARLPSEGAPYPIFAYTGLLPWLFFSSSVGAASHSLVSSAHLITKVYFPRLLAPLSSVGAAVVDFGIAAALLIPLLIVYRLTPSVRLLATPLVLLWITISAIALGALLSALVARWRDFAYVTSFLLQIWMYVTPVAYSMELIPQRWQPVFFLNPMAGPVSLFRWVAFGSPLDPVLLSLSLAATCVLFLAGMALFHRLERDLVDVV